MEYIRDDWPTLPEGSDYDGKNLLQLVLLQLVRDNTLHTRVTDIPALYKGSNNYGIHLQLDNQPDILVGLGHSDVNMPNFDGFPVDVQATEARIEAAVYSLLQREETIPVSPLLYHRLPVLHPAPRSDRPRDLAGRRLYSFQRPQGRDNVRRALSPAQKVGISLSTPDYGCYLAYFDPSSLLKAAQIRASLFSFTPDKFTRVAPRTPLRTKTQVAPIPVAPIREFCIAFFESKINATIGNIGDIIGWEDDNNSVGPIAAAPKQSLEDNPTHHARRGRRNDVPLLA
ncbi:hypothetical protein BDW62DRAFT_202616 [Aspergillus aurantiobrunneus]